MPQAAQSISWPWEPESHNMKRAVPYDLYIIGQIEYHIGHESEMTIAPILSVQPMRKVAANAENLSRIKEFGLSKVGV